MRRVPSNTPPHLPGRDSSRLLRTLCFAAAVLLTFTIARVNGWLAMTALAYVALTSLSPFAGLLVLAAFLPLASILTGVLRLDVAGADLLVLSFLASAALHYAIRSGPRSDRVVYPAALLVLVAAASYAVQLVEIRARLGNTMFHRNLWLLLTGHYLRGAIQLEGLVATITFVAGIALFMASRAALAPNRHRLMSFARVAAAGAGAAAALNVLRLVEISLRTGGSVSALLRMAREHRINVHYADVNAAGSYFALMIFLPLALAIASRSVTRLLWSAVAVLVGIAIWLTGSRAAVLSVIVVGAAAAAYQWRGDGAPRPLSRRVAPMLVIGALALVVLLFLPNRIIGRGTSVALEVRRDMAFVSIQLLRTNPLFGVGVGQFYSASGEPLSKLPTGRYYFHENAHNNFLQILAELGIVGMGALIWLGIETLRNARNTKASSETPVADRAFVLGVVAFLLTALLGHPLLTRDVAYVFWMMTGVLAAGTTVGAAGAGARKSIIVLGALILASIPLRGVAALRSAELEHVGYGLSGWRVSDEGIRYRTADRNATVFAPASAAIVEIPIRLSDAASEPVLVDITLDDRLIDRLHVTHEWRHYRLRLPAAARSRFIPVTFRISRPDPLRLDIGRVAILQNRE